MKTYKPIKNPLPIKIKICSLQDHERLDENHIAIWLSSELGLF